MATKISMVVSAFPGCGKTYLYEHQDELTFKDYVNGDYIQCSFVDSDSSKFEKSGEWAKEYVDYIASNIGKCDFIFVSQHEEVLKELNTRGIPFVIVAPATYVNRYGRLAQCTKNQWFGRYVLRDNSHIEDLCVWIELLDQNWEKWTSKEHLSKHNPAGIYRLATHEFLEDAIPLLYEHKECSHVFNGERDICTCHTFMTPDMDREDNQILGKAGGYNIYP